MLNEGQPDEVHAFHNNIAASHGTKDMVRQARESWCASHDPRSVRFKCR